MADSVKSLEDHFTKLGEAHKDLGEGVLDKEELRSRGKFPQFQWPHDLL